jgi:PUA domain protein
MKSQTLSDRRIDELRDDLRRLYGVDPFPDDGLIRRVEYGDGVITVDGDPAYAFDNGDIFPLISTLIDDVFIPSITVDMGAVKPVVSGADIMYPGIIRADDDVTSGSIVVIIDEDNAKPIAVARVTDDADGLVEKDSGVAGSSVHYVGDDLWDEFIG